MARLLVVALVVIIPAVLAVPVEKTERQERQLPIAQGQTASGATGLNYGNTQASNENHNKKNFGVNFSSDQGNSNSYGQTGLQAAAAGGIAQAQGPVYPGYPYQHSPYYPNYYPQYPQVYPGAGVPNLGVGSNVAQGYPRYSVW